LPVKQTIIGSMYPEKLVFENKSYRTKKLHEGITLMCNMGKGYGVAKIGQASDFGSLSEVVASSGIEPESGASEALILSIVLRGQ
jgi:site-specific DNA recombinase